jgi:hypothetical protein
MNREQLASAINPEYSLRRRNAMSPAAKEKSKKVASSPKPRKAKFQADLAPSEDSMVRVLKAELQLTSNTDFLSDALALFRWAVSERKRGNRIFSESSTGERKVLLFPSLERVAPEVSLPHVEIQWSGKELESLAALAAEPTEALIRAMRH